MKKQLLKPHFIEVFIRTSFNLEFFIEVSLLIKQLSLKSNQIFKKLLNYFFGGDILKDYVLVPSSLGELIKKARKGKNLTQEELTDELAISTGTVSNVERGNYKVSKQKLFDLCKKLDLDLTKIKLLFDEEDNKNTRYNLKMQLMSIEHILDLVSHETGWEDLCKIQLDKNEPLRSFYEYLRGRCYEEEKNWKQAEICFLNSIRNIDSHEDLQKSNIKSACFNGLSRIHNRQDNMDKALYYVEKGLDTFVSDGERKHVYYHLLISKVVYLEKINRNREALIILEELWTEKDQIESSEARLNMYQMMAALHNKFEMYEDAIELALEGLEKSRVDKMYDRTFELWTTLGESYSRQGNVSKGEICFQTALKLIPKVRRKYLIVSTQLELGVLHLQKGDAKTAEKILLEAVQLGHETKDSFRLIKALSSLGDCYIFQGLMSKLNNTIWKL